MLGALILAIQVFLYWYCWGLNKQLKIKKANNTKITKSSFVWCCFINFIVLVPIFSLVFLVLSNIIIGEFKTMNDDGVLVVIFLLAIISVLCLIAYHYSKYKDYIDNDSGVMPDAIGQTVADVRQAVSSPNSFLETMSFRDFVMKYGPKVGIASHINKVTGREFHTVEVKDSDGKTVSIRFHSSLGDLSSEQLKNRKDELYVGKRAMDHRWYLYDTHFTENGKWEDVELSF